VSVLEDPGSIPGTSTKSEQSVNQLTARLSISLLR